MSNKSKLLSLILRHKPETVGVELDAEGWVNVTALLDGLRNHGQPMELDELRGIVETNDKKRFAFSPCGTLIRASQGHSVEVDLGLIPVKPPDYLYHGTAESNHEAIRRSMGLKPMGRQYVHLSEDPETARKVGSRHGKPIVFQVSSWLMYKDGINFYRSANGVWLVGFVPFDRLGRHW